MPVPYPELSSASPSGDALRLNRDMADYVLGVMRKPEREIAGQMAVETAEAVAMILTEGVGKAMTRFNKRVESAEKDLE